jgi:hypothetical protein
MLCVPSEFAGEGLLDLDFDCFGNDEVKSARGRKLQNQRRRAAVDKRRNIHIGIDDGKEHELGRLTALTGAAFLANLFDQVGDVDFSKTKLFGLLPSVSVHLVPPAFALVSAQGLANEFAHGAVLFFGERGGPLQHFGRQGDGNGLGGPHTNNGAQCLTLRNNGLELRRPTSTIQSL